MSKPMTQGQMDLLMYLIEEREIPEEVEEAVEFLGEMDLSVEDANHLMQVLRVAPRKEGLTWRVCGMIPA